MANTLIDINVRVPGPFAPIKNDPFAPVDQLYGIANEKTMKNDVSLIPMSLQFVWIPDPPNQDAINVK